jgi:hypothetical protein
LTNKEDIKNNLIPMAINNSEILEQAINIKNENYHALITTFANEQSEFKNMRGFIVSIEKNYITLKTLTIEDFLPYGEHQWSITISNIKSIIFQ